jgi:hypothetical protein
MNVGTTQFLCSHVFVRHRLHHVGSRNEHVRDSPDHEDKIRDCRTVYRTARAGTEDGAYLRDHSRHHRVPEEYVGVTAERDYSFLNTRTAGVVEADQRESIAHRKVHDLTDLLSVSLSERPSENSEVLRKYIDLTTIDAAIAGDYSVTQRFVVS